MPAQAIRCPFVRHEGVWYIVVGWCKNMPAGSRLRLRPLSRRESQLVERYLENFSAEVWAVIAAKDQ